MKKLFVKDLRLGDTVEDVFVLAEKNLAQKRDGGNYLTFTLADRTGRIKGVMWEGLDAAVGGLAAGGLVRIRGSISEYRGALQLVTKTMESCSGEDFDPAAFVPASGWDVDKMMARLVEICATVQDPHIKRLFELFWEDEVFLHAFKKAPAAKRMHHAYIGGLLEHTLSMTVLADRLCDHYNRSAGANRKIDRDLLLAGVVLHDAGKVHEFVYDSQIDYSDRGRLVSHIVIAVELLNEKLQCIEAFPEKKAELLKHMIVSHHGAREFGSPEPPKTIEALLLHYIDEMDSKINAIRDFMASEDPAETWTSYHRLLERHFYKGSAES